MRVADAFDSRLSRARWQLAALQVQAKLARLGLALRAFDRNQPRVPAGSPDGGQWTSDGGTTGTVRDDRVVVAQLDPKRRIEINREEEKHYGHAYTRHVAKTDAEMFELMRPVRSIYPIPREERRVSFGTSATEQDAHYYITETLNNNRAEISDIIADKSGKDRSVDYRFGYPTGREAFRPSALSEPAIRDTYEVRVIIKPDPRRNNGFSVISAFPYNSQGRPR